MSHGFSRTLILLGTCLLGVAIVPTAIGDLLAAAGMDGRAAAIAGSRLTVMMALFGAGLLLVGLTTWARSQRLVRSCLAYAELLEALEPSTVRIVEGPAVLAIGEFDGLRAEIVVHPQSGASAVIRAQCHPATRLEVWPRGLVPADLPPGSRPSDGGAHWEGWVESGAFVLEGGADLLETVFAGAAAEQVSHDNTGISIRLSLSPPETLLQRLRVGIDMAVYLAKANR